jgi:hypothetical protein
MNEQIDLRPDLKRNMDPSAMGNDLAALRQICGMLNDPNLTGASVPEEEKEANQKLFAGVAAAVPAAPPPPLPPTATAKPKAKALPKSGPVKGTIPAKLVSGSVFFTGHPKVGKSHLAALMGARPIEFDDPIYAMAATAFGKVDEIATLRHFIQEVRAWGDGEVSPAFALNSARALFTLHVRNSGNDGRILFGIDPREFGSPGFWVRSLLARTQRIAASVTPGPVAVTDVSTVDQYQALRQAGFSPYHVMAHNVTRSARGGSVSTNGLADSIERDITQQISKAAGGAKFWAVWSDEKYPPPTSRLLTVAEFLDRVTK